MGVFTSLTIFFLILIIYFSIGTIIGGYLLKLILTKFKIKIKDKKKIFFISALPYIIGIFGNITSSYIHKIFNLISLLLIFYLTYFYIKKSFAKKALQIAVIWNILFLILNFVLGIILVIILTMLEITIVPA